MGEGEKNTSHTAQQHRWHLAAELARCSWRGGRNSILGGGGGGGAGKFGTEKTGEAKRRPGRQLQSGREQDVS